MVGRRENDGDDGRATLPLPLALEDNEAAIVSITAHSDPAATAALVDKETGEDIPQEEAAFRALIDEQTARGLVAIDPVYAATADAIHQPLVNEQGFVVDNAWALPRANRTHLRVDLTDLGRLSLKESDQATLQELAVMVAHRVIGELPAALMKQLYIRANDAGRVGHFSVRLSDLLDALNYTRDKRGVHYTANRRIVSQALLALQITQIGINIARRGRTAGFVAPLLAGLAYDMPQSVVNMSPREIFERGLPENISVTINPHWYQLRDATGRPTDVYTLVTRESLMPPPRTRGSYRRATTAQVLQHYLDEKRSRVPDGRLILKRKALISQANITDRNRANATRTLTRALEKLVTTGILASYMPSPLPLDPDEEITLVYGVASPLV